MFEVINVGPDDLCTSLETFRRYDNHGLGFIDGTTVAFCKARGIHTVLSFDSDFDGLLDRVERFR